MTKVYFEIDFRLDSEHELHQDSDGNSEVRRIRNYDEDALRVWGKLPSFLDSPRFKSAYQAGVDSGIPIFAPPPDKENSDPGVRWRSHVCLWAATQALKLKGDFVECGVNTGFQSAAICSYVNFNQIDKDFHLFDTFSGIPHEQKSTWEKDMYPTSNYDECYQQTKRNFSQYPRVYLHRGKVPDTLYEVEIEHVAYLHIDMNIVVPEIAAIEHFYSRLVAGAVVVLDDYGWFGHHEQHIGFNEFARSKSMEILNLPTGQGLMIKV